MEPCKVQRTIEARKEVKEPKRRFQIVKLEERIAPRACYGHGHHRYCYRR